MDISDTFLFTPCSQREDRFNHLRVVHSALGDEWGKAYARARSADGVADSLQHLLRKTDPVSQATAILIGTFVRCPAKKLIDQITITTVHLNTIKTGVNRI